MREEEASRLRVWHVQRRTNARPRRPAGFLSLLHRTAACRCVRVRTRAPPDSSLTRRRRDAKRASESPLSSACTKSSASRQPRPGTGWRPLRVSLLSFLSHSRLLRQTSVGFGSDSVIASIPPPFSLIASIHSPSFLLSSHTIFLLPLAFASLPSPFLSFAHETAHAPSIVRLSLLWPLKTGRPSGGRIPGPVAWPRWRGVVWRCAPGGSRSFRSRDGARTEHRVVVAALGGLAGRQHIFSPAAHCQRDAAH